MLTTNTPNQALLKNPELVEGPFRPAKRDRGPEFIEGRRTGRELPPAFDTPTGRSPAMADWGR